ncbi:MAG: DEAD/DEAH box helicase [Actinobacteria bacterium]|nr:DEAD/DEAH box helicase [Actinomycetota bacterium]
MTEQQPPIVESPIALPATSRSFADFGVSPEVVEALAMRNVNGTFEIQAMVLLDAIHGRDVLARSRTGSGKTLAFAVPIVERLKSGARHPAALVLVPTRELASQVAEEFRGIADAKRLKVATVYGGVGIADQAKRAARAAVVIATPGRLLDLVRRKLLTISHVEISVLDEADRMLDMGFLPDVSKILAMLPEKRQTMLFSATLDGEVGGLAQRYTHDPVRHEIRDERPVVEQAAHRFIAVPQEDKLNVLVRELAGERGLTLIFVRTKRWADRLAHELKQQGFQAQALHGDMSQAARERTLARFVSAKADTLVATDVAARGLDVEDITHVVNYDPPDDEKAYVHRVGRTARAGRTGTGITLVTPDQRADVSRIAKRLNLEAEFIEAGMKIAAPRSLYSTASRGRGSLLGKRPRRRF